MALVPKRRKQPEVELCLAVVSGFNHFGCERWNSSAPGSQGELSCMLSSSHLSFGGM